MRAVLTAAAFHTMIFALLCAALFAAFIILPDVGIKWYPGVVMSVVALSPLFYSKFTAKLLYSMLHRPLARPEHITFGLLLASLIGLIAGLSEAAVVYQVYGRESGISFTELVLAPLSERYTLSTGSFSFAAKALFAGAGAGVIFIPARVRLLDTAAKG